MVEPNALQAILTFIPINETTLLNKGDLGGSYDLLLTIELFKHPLRCVALAQTK
jgi:hypothetical protein